MPICSTPELTAIVDHLMLVVDPKVSMGLRDLRYILVEKCTALSNGNPAIYLNSLPAQKRVVGWVNNAKIGAIEAEQGNSIAVNQSAMADVPLFYGILLHETAHAWLEKCKVTNSERNAYLFEIQWVYALAALPNSNMATRMREGLDAYIAKRKAAFDAASGVKEALQWTQSRYKF